MRLRRSRARSSPSPERFARPRRLLKLAEGSPMAFAFAAYVPEGQDAERMVDRCWPRAVGLKIAPAVAARIAGRRGERSGDRRAGTAEARPLSRRVAPSAEGAGSRRNRRGRRGQCRRRLRSGLADLALGGDVRELADELARLPRRRIRGIPVVRSLQRRLLMLAPARARIERGERLDAVMTSLGKSLFWKDKALSANAGDSGTRTDLATVAERAGRLERAPDVQPRARARSARRRTARDRARRAPALDARSARPKGAGRSCRAGRGSNNAA